jgi:hypothetical protein
MLTHEDGGMMGQFIVESPIVGVNEINQLNETVVYPNPVEDILTIDTEPNSQLQLTDNFGRIILDETAIESTHKMNLSNLNHGIYFIQISTNDKIEIVKFLKN